MTFIYLQHGGPNGEIARVQGYTHGSEYLGIYRRWPGCYTLVWQPTGRTLAECHTQKGAENLASMIAGQYKLYQAPPPPDGVDVAWLLEGWRRIYPNELPARERKRPARAGWVQAPYRVTAHGYPDGAWEIGGYVRGITGAVEMRREYGSGRTIDLTHLPTGFLYGYVDTWELATIMADTIATVLPGGTFGVAPTPAELHAAHEAIQAARIAYADQLSADRAA